MLLVALSPTLCLAQQPACTPPQSSEQSQPPAQAQSAAAQPQPSPTPAMTGPVQAAAPITFNAGPFGQLDLTGAVSGMALFQAHPVPGDTSPQADLSNGQIFIQKPEGLWQFYLQLGVYNIPALGASFVSTGNTTNDLYGPVPVGFLKLAPFKNFNVMIGSLPTLIGAEYTFTFENMNIERGLLWNQENAINRGVQINGTPGRMTASLSWNDGFYSNRYTWLTGSVAYAFNSTNTLSFTAGGNFGQTVFRTLATPMQNNSTIYDVIYTYSRGNWIVQPYWQYTSVPTNEKIEIINGTATNGGALLVNYNFKRSISLAARAEYVSSTGSAATQTVNVLYGPGSNAWSATVTPTFQDHAFFARADFSVVRANGITPGDGFGPGGLNRTQLRGLIELGFMF